jgi:hypothetical protein
MKVITVLTTFGEIIGKTNEATADLFASFANNHTLDIEKPVMIVPIMTERGPGVSFRPVMISSQHLSELCLRSNQVVYVEHEPPKQLVDEYLQMTSGIILSGC